MPTIHECTVHDLLVSLPEWEATQVPTGDLFIGAIGFEERSAVGFEKWCEHATTPGASALLIAYPINKELNDVQRARFYQAANRSQITVDEVPYQRLTLYADVLRRVRGAAKPNVIVLDISSMASFAFYPVIAALCEGAAESELNICYTEAVEYFPSLEEWEGFKAKAQNMDLLERARLFDESHFHSKGVNIVYESINFPGTNVGNLQTRLVVVPNFSFERVNRMIEFCASRYHIERANCEWIIGMSPDQDKNAWRYQAVWEMYAKPDAKREASIINYKEMILTLQQLWEQYYLSESLVIATVGSKAQHLGTVLFLLMHPEVGLILAEPKEHNASRYSAKAGTQRSVTLGKIGALVERVQKWNRLEFGWDAP